MKITIQPPIPSFPDRFSSDYKKSLLELTITKFKPIRLHRGYAFFIILCVYILEWAAYGQQAALFQLDATITSAIKNTSKGSKSLIIVAGDLNGANISSLLSSQQLIQLNHKATWKNNVLDLIIKNAPDYYSTSIILAIKTSDHKVVIAVPPTNAECNRTLARKVKNYARSGKIADTVAIIRTTNWYERLPFKIKNFIFSNAQLAFDQLYAVAYEAVEYNQSLKITKVRDDKPWMTQEKKPYYSKDSAFFMLENKLNGKLFVIESKVS